jgi:hypothetical protein
MPGRLRTIVLACALATALAGCGSGGDGTIPKQDADNLVSLLDGIESDLAAHDCDLIPQHVNAFAEQVNSLPPEVDDEVQKGLIQGADRLVELSKQPEQCQDVSGASGATSTTEETTTTTTEPEETTTTTEPEETTTTTTQPEEESPPANGGNEQGGNGNGPPLEVPGEGNPGGGRGGGSDSGGLTGRRQSR